MTDTKTEKHKYIVKRSPFAYRDPFTDPVPEEKEVFPNTDPNGFLQWCGHSGFADPTNARDSARVWYEKYYKPGWEVETMLQAAQRASQMHCFDTFFFRALKDREDGLPMLKPKWLK